MSKQFPKRAIHLDFHTMPSAYNLGDNFNASEFAQTLSKAGVDYITVFARCNIGFAYYPTKFGIIHPGLIKDADTDHPSIKVDMLGEMVDACHKEGIRVAAYFNAGLDHEHALLHRDWCRLDEQGRVVKMAEMYHFFRLMCFNTGYSDHLKSMIEEVLDKYPVDGIFLDCFYRSPCYGAECLSKMQQLGMDINDPEQVAEFAHMSNTDFCNEVTELVREKSGEDTYIIYNGMPYDIQPTHIEIEVLPTGGWGYDYLPFVIRYVRTLDKPYFTMTGRFHKGWGDFGGLRTEQSLKFDLLYSLANGGTCSVGDHLHPLGKLEAAVYDLVGKVYSDVKKLEPWTYGSKPQAEILVLNPALRDFPARWDASFDSVRGVTRMLSELKQQFDISDGRNDLNKYRLVILPDDVTVDDELLSRIQSFRENGGAVICSGYGGFTSDKSRFAVDPESVVYEGPEPYDPIFYVPESEVKQDIPDLPIAVYSQAAAVQAGADAKILAGLIKPYTNVRFWDGYHEHLYNPPEKDTGRPAVIKNGNLVYISFPIFTGYYKDAVISHKMLIRNILQMLLPAPMLQIDNLPSFGQATVAESDTGDTLVHLLCYVPESRGNSQAIEESIMVQNVEVKLRKDCRSTKHVSLALTGEELPFKEADGYICVTVPKVDGYQLLVFSEK